MTLSARIRRALFFPVGVLLLGGFLPGASTPVQGQERNVPSQRPSAGLRIGFVSVGNLVPLPPDLQPERTIRWIMHQVYGPGLIEPPGREEDAPVYLLASEFGPRPVRGTWRIRLRPGVVFHDGSELDPEDVRETLLLYKRLAEAGHPDIDPVFRLIDSVEVRADGAVDFTLGRHLQDQPWRIGRVVPLPAGRARLVRGDLSEMQGQLIAQFVDRPPVGLGGYRYEPVDPRTSDPGEALFVLRAFDRYFQGRPVFREAMIRFYPNERQLMQAVVTGELDVVGILPRLASEELTSLLANRVEVQYRRFPQTEHFYYLALNNATWPFEEREARQAVRLAVDRNQLRLGYPVTLSPISDIPVQPAPNSGERAPVRRRAAMNLLQDLGFRVVNDLLTGRDGRPVRLRLHYPDHYRTYERMARNVKNDLQRLGLLVDAIPVHPSELKARLSSGDYDLALYEMDLPPTPEGLFHFFATDPARGVNFTRYGSVAFRSNLNAALSPPAGTSLQEYWNGALERFEDDVPLIPIYFDLAQHWAFDGAVVDVRSVGVSTRRMEPLARWRR